MPGRSPVLELNHRGYVCGSRTSLGWVREPAQEQEASGTRVADEEDERMVSAKDGRRRRLLHDRASRDGNGCRGRRFGTFFVNLTPSFVEDPGNVEQSGPIHAG